MVNGFPGRSRNLVRAAVSKRGSMVPGAEAAGGVEGAEWAWYDYDEL